MSDVTTIEWRRIPEAHDYEISNNGRVRSLDRYRDHPNGPRLLRGVELKPYQRVSGHLCVTITTNEGRRRNVNIHNQMARAFFGPPPTPTHEARHLNDVKIDNRIENLAWGTKSENALDSVRNGIHHMSRKLRCDKGHEFDAIEQTSSGRTRRRCTECKKRPPAPPRLQRVCSIEDCPRKHYSRSWCRIHYMHWREFGNPLDGVFGRGGDRRKSV